MKHTSTHLFKSVQLIVDMCTFELVKDIGGGNVPEGFFRGATRGWGPSQEAVICGNDVYNLN